MVYYRIISENFVEDLLSEKVEVLRLVTNFTTTELNRFTYMAKAPRIRFRKQMVACAM